jgi:hypothetical protein
VSNTFYEYQEPLKRVYYAYGRMKEEFALYADRFLGRHNKLSFLAAVKNYVNVCEMILKTKV